MRPILAFALAALLAAGCIAPAAPKAPRSLVDAVADTSAHSWDKGSWWAYHAVVKNQTLDVALVVADASASGFTLGTNVSSGFFGLPFQGNVTRDLNPTLGPTEWPLYRFPLEDGQTWEYKLFGYDAKTVARAAMVDVPGLGPAPGFTLEASSFGRAFAKYDYSPTTGWFTTLELIDPAKGETVLRADLTEYGAAYGRGYYVERLLREVTIPYPAVPGQIDVDVPGGSERVALALTAESDAGLIDLALRSGDGSDALRARSVGRGADVERLYVHGARTYTLVHQGAGQGYAHLSITGIERIGPAAGGAGGVEAWSVGDVLAVG